MAFTFGSLFRETWARFSRDWQLFVGIAFLLSFVPSLAVLAGYYVLYGTIPETTTMFDFASQPVLMILSVLLTLSVLEALRMKKSKPVSETIKAGANHFWKGLGLTIVVSCAVLLLLLLLIIPGIIFGIYWTFAYFMLVFEEKGIVDSMKASKKLVEGRWWKVFGYSLLMLLVIILITMAIIMPFGIAAVFIGLVNEMAAEAMFAFIFIIMSALQALMVLFMLIFYERFYRVLKK